MNFLDIFNEKLMTFGKSAYPQFGQIVIMSGGAGCFVGETNVKTAKGLKPIQDINIGDSVLSYNEKTKEKKYQKVTKTFEYENIELLRLTFDNGETIECTPDHKFLINDEWVKAREIVEDSVKKEYITKKEKVYDIEVENNHNYCLTDSEIIVHNSGKGFVLKNLAGIEGIVLDVDRLKELVRASTKFNATIKEKYGIDASKLDLKTPEDVAKLHDVVSGLHINDRKIEGIFKSLVQAAPNRKPNLIFDVTLKDLNKFHNIMRNVQDMGYWKKNIHLVWVLNTLDVALQQNKERDRMVPEEILISTHKGASYTMSEIIKMGEKLRDYLDGAIYVSFNQKGIDVQVTKGEEKTINPEVFKKKGQTAKPSFIGKVIDQGAGKKPKIESGADYVKLKDQGSAPLSISEIEKEVLDKIRAYVPNPDKIW